MRGVVRRGVARGLSVLLGLALLVAGVPVVGVGQAAPESQRALKVVTTVGMISDIVANVGGDRVQVTGLMGPGVDPHLYRATEGDVRRLAEADIIFYGGLNLEAKMADVLKRVSGRVRTVAVTDGIDRARLLEADDSPDLQKEYDPHVWFDVTLWMSAVETVRDTLVARDATNAATYTANATKYLAEMQTTHQYLLDQAARVTPAQRVLITSHDAFRYFGRAYGFEVRGLQGISTATEAGTGDVQALAEFIATRKIRAIFIESSVPQRSIEAVQAAVQARGFTVEIGGELFSDALGDPGAPEGTYLGMVRYNIDTIVGALVKE